MKSTNTIITIIILVLVGAGVYVLSENKGDESIMKEYTMMMEKEVMMSSSSNIVNENKTVSTTSNSVVVKAASYEAYSPEKLANAEAGNIVLFFKASWCPSCRAADADIKKNMLNIPANLTILEVDYDKSSDLKKKYGVTSQHTFVQVDKDGNMIKKWSGGNTLNSVVAEVK